MRCITRNTIFASLTGVLLLSAWGIHVFAADTAPSESTCEKLEQYCDEALDRQQEIEELYAAIGLTVTLDDPPLCLLHEQTCDGEEQCATFTHGSEPMVQCATCGDGVCTEFENCTSSHCTDQACTDDCGGLYCPEDCNRIEPPDLCANVKCTYGCEDGQCLSDPCHAMDCQFGCEAGQCLPGPECGNNICEKGEADEFDPGGCGPGASPLCLGRPGQFIPGSCPQDCGQEQPTHLCPEYLLTLPPEGCEYVWKSDANNCEHPELVCPEEADTAALPGNCVVTGCSGELCVDEQSEGALASTCVWRPEFACYDGKTCVRQANGSCGWLELPEIEACVTEQRAASKPSVTGAPQGPQLFSVPLGSISR